MLIKTACPAHAPVPLPVQPPFFCICYRRPSHPSSHVVPCCLFSQAMATELHLKWPTLALDSESNVPLALAGRASKAKLTLHLKRGSCPYYNPLARFLPPCKSGTYLYGVHECNPACLCRSPTMCVARSPASVRSSSHDKSGPYTRYTVHTVHTHTQCTCTVQTHSDKSGAYT